MSTQTSPPPVLSYAPPGRPPLSFRQIWDSAGMLIVFLALFVGASIFVPNFFSVVNFKGLLLSVTTVGIVACSMLFCLAAGDFDLSVGSVVGLAGMMTAIVINATGSIFLGVGAGLLVGAIVGLFNGIIIARVGINALITTLATMQIVRGITYIACGGPPVGVTKESFYALGIASMPNLRISGVHIGIPVPVWIMLACFIVFGIVLNRTTFGRNTLAIGGNREAAYLAGIPVVRTKVLIFALQGLLAAFAGIILTARFTGAHPINGTGLELLVIAACVLGGVSLTGGVGTMGGVVVGVLIMGTVVNVMNLLVIPTYYQMVVSGAVLLAAVLIDRLRR